MTKWAETHLPCDACGSSDALSRDIAGGTYCFSCGALGGDADFNAPLTTGQSEIILGGQHKQLTSRGISKEVCQFFDVKVHDSRLLFPYHDSDKSLVAQKIRPLSEKVFYWKGSKNQATLFGQNKFTSGRYITIVEGEMDALAYRELMGDYPVVSISSGAKSAPEEIKKHLDYFENFGKIHICMDNDEAGNTAAFAIADLFPMGKAKIVNLRHYKDANDYLIAGKRDEFKKCWWDAVDYTPAGIEPANNGGFDSLFDDIDNLELFPYPFEKLNETTFGVRKGEMVTLVAGSGVGKSAFTGEIAYKFLTETGKKVGMLMLEESPKKTKLRIMSLHLDKPLHLTLLGRVAEKFDFLKSVLGKLFKNDSDWSWTPEIRKQLKVAWDEVIERKAEDGENQLWLFSHFGSNNIDTIVNRIDAMVTGLGCEFIFLDHISIVVSEQQNGDERKALDELATKLRTLVERRNFALIMVSHLRRPGGKPHEEGGETSLSDIRGTAGIGQLSDIVLGLERNGQHENEQMRNITKIRVLKNRFSGFTGLSAFAEYDVETGRLTEVDRKVVEDLEKTGDTTEFRPEESDRPLFDATPSGQSLGAERIDTKSVETHELMNQRSS